MERQTEYTKPTVEEYGSVESITQDTDKIGDYDDAVDFGDLDGSIIPDP